MATAKSGETLRQLVAGLKTRRPDEVMGQVASSSLIGSVVTAAVALIGFMLATTALVFVVMGPPAVREKPDRPVAEAATANPANAVATQAAQESSDDQSALEAPIESDPVQAMGIGETKDPDAAPDSLDNRLDDLLKGLE